MEIQSLVPDIYRIIKNKKDGWFTDELAVGLGTRIASVVKTQLGDERPASRLRISRLGVKCPRALWFSVHHPELAQPYEPWAEIKFSYGHILEALAITLAKASGHRVEGEQDELNAAGVVGHRDCVIDGNIVDFKSADTRSFQKYKTGLLETDDPFGTCCQLDGYLLGSLDDPLVTNKKSAFFLAIDKTLGHLCLHEHPFREAYIRNRIEDQKRIVALPSPPPCECGTRASGESGNIELDLVASYSDYKYSCFPNLRTFIYSGGPTYLTKVVKIPKHHGVPLREVDRFGRTVYNG